MREILQQITYYFKECSEYNQVTNVRLTELQNLLRDASSLCASNHQPGVDDPKTESLWCQKFHKERTANMELRGKVSKMADSYNDLQRQISEYQEIISELNSSLRSYRHNKEENVQVASIAIQTYTSLDGEESEKQTDDYLAFEKISIELSAIKETNRNLEKILREKELVIITKEEQINRLKSEGKYTIAEQTTGDTPRSLTSHPMQSSLMKQASDKEDQETIQKYQTLLEEAHRGSQNDHHNHKRQYNSVARERDDALKKVRELQLILDSIPFKDNEFGQQQSLFVDHIQSLTESNMVLEKQLSLSRTEKAKMEAEKSELERLLVSERTKHSALKEKQETACKTRHSVLQKENERLRDQWSNHVVEVERLRTVNTRLQREVDAIPSVLLSGLMKKMRDELVAKDKIIAQLRNQVVSGS